MTLETLVSHLQRRKLLPEESLPRYARFRAHIGARLGTATITRLRAIDPVDAVNAWEAAADGDAA